MDGRILITGASGFIGRALVPVLRQIGIPIRVAVRPGSELPQWPGVEITRVGDFNQPIDWASVVEGADRVVHLAGIAHAENSNYSAADYHRVNVAATGALAQASVRAGVKRFVFMSSIRAQSAASAVKVLTEDDVPNPTDDYGRAKLTAEAELRAAGVPHTILRPVVVYGPNAKSNIARLARLAALPLPLPFAGFHNRRSLLGIDNLIAAISFALMSPAAIDQTFIVADPDPLGLADIIATLRVASGRSPLLFDLPPQFIALGLKMIGRGDLWDRIGGNLQADPRKLIAAGWAPAHDARTGLAKMVQAGHLAR